MNTPFFSIIITLYNKEQYIAKTLESVLHQDYSKYEIIVVNDGSTDNSLAAVNRYKTDSIKVFSIENSGAAFARNYGIKKANYDYIALLDGDDIWEPFYLSEISALINHYDDHKVFATSKRRLKNNKISIPRYSFKNPNNKKWLTLDFFTSSYIEPILHSSSCVIHTSVFDTVGYFDTSIKSGQDTDLWIRIGLAYKIAFSTRICVTYYINPGGLFNSITKIEDKINFRKFKEVERSNPRLKKYIDINRFSHVIFCKINGYVNEAAQIKNRIDRKNLNSKQRFILNLNTGVILMLLKLKNILEKLHIKVSPF